MTAARMKWWGGWIGRFAPDPASPFSLQIVSFRTKICVANLKREI